MQLKQVLACVFITLIAGCDWQGSKQVQGYVEGENIYLASPYSGQLEELWVDKGQHVKKGQLLFKLNSSPQSIHVLSVEGNLEQAVNKLNDLEKPRRLPEIKAIEAQIEQSNAQIHLAQIRVDRLQKLYTRQATDKDSVDAAVAHLKQQQQLKQQYESNLALAKLGSREDEIRAQKAQVNSISAQLSQAKWELAQKTVFAPEEGVIFDTYYSVGEFVPSERAVASLLTPKHIRIEFFVPLAYLPKLKLGQKITFDCAGCRNPNHAKVTYISPDAEYLPPLVYSRENASKLVFRIKASIVNASSFAPGLPVEVNLP
jgi:HlyD family secretion protein